MRASLHSVAVICSELGAVAHLAGRAGGNWNTAVQITPLDAAEVQA